MLPYFNHYAFLPIFFGHPPDKKKQNDTFNKKSHNPSLFSKAVLDQ